MRTGPGRNYPGTWLYKRRDLPVRVIKTYPNWRMIEDPDGTRGWMLVTLLSDQRTAIVKPGEPRAIHMELSETSRVRYRAEPGVVGRIDKCDGHWCHIQIGKRQGYIAQGDIWGVERRRNGRLIRRCGLPHPPDRSHYIVNGTYATRLTVSFSPLSLVVSPEPPSATIGSVQQTSPSLSMALVKQALPAFITAVP